MKKPSLLWALLLGATLAHAQFFNEEVKTYIKKQRKKTTPYNCTVFKKNKPL